MHSLCYHEKLGVENHADSWVYFSKCNEIADVMLLVECRGTDTQVLKSRRKKVKFLSAILN